MQPCAVTDTRSIQIHEKARFYGEDPEEERYEYMVVCYNPWSMDFTSGIYLAEIRDFHVTETQLPGRQPKREHHGDP
jgi:hypothetical protein